MIATLLACLLAATAGLLLPRSRAEPGRPSRRAPARVADAPRRPRGRQAVMSGLAGAAAALFLGGTVAVVAGPAVAVVCWRVLGRVEPTVVRRAREQTARDLPHLVGLMAAGLRAGAPPATALGTACAALPGAAADAFAATRARLDLGVDPAAVWADLAASDGPDGGTGWRAAGPSGVATLGRTLARAHHTGASVRETVEALADQLADEARAEVEDRARSVGVKAALPLGLCLLPAFLLLGIVPVVAGLAAQLATG